MRTHTDSRALRGAAIWLLLSGCSPAPGPGGQDGGADLAFQPPTPDLSLPADAGTADAGTADAGTGVPPIPRYSLSGPARAMLHVGNAWYVGGAFNRISQYPSTNLIPLDPTGAPTKCPIDAGFDGGVAALAVSGNSIYAAGAFTHYKGASANRIAKIDATTCALDTTFSPPANNGFPSLVLALGISGTSIYVGGQFTTYRGVSANRIAKLDLTTGALDTIFSPPENNGFDNNIMALVTAGSSVYLGGTFNAYRGATNSAIKLAKLDLTTGALDPTFSPAGVGANGFSDTVTALFSSATSLYVGGYFTAYRGVANSAVRLAKLDLATGVIDTTFSPVGGNGFNDVVFVLTVSGNALYAGGRFATYRGVTGAANMIAKLDKTTGALDATFSPPANNGFLGTQVTAIAVSGPALFVGGTFTAYRNVANSANNLAKLDAATGAQDPTFLPPQSNTNGVAGSLSDFTTIIAAVMQGPTLWLGGRFTVYGGYSVNNLMKLDDRTFAVDTSFSPPANNGFDSTVSALASDGISLYAGGSFNVYRGVLDSAHRLAKLDPTSGVLDTTFGPAGATGNGFDSTVQALAATRTSLYAGGSFTAYRGVTSANRLAKLDLASGALDPTFSPSGATANGFDSSVQALAIAGMSLYAGGSFTAYRGVVGSAKRLAKLDLISGVIDTTFSPQAANGFDGVVNALSVAGAALYVGGGFTAYTGVADSAHRLAKLSLLSGAIDTAFSPTNGATANGFDDAVNALAITGGALYAGGNFTAYRGAANSALRLARLDPASGALDTTFSPPGATANGLDCAVTALGVFDPFLLVSGSFSAYRGATPLARSWVLLDGMTGALK